jgi:hypothetical protein
MKRAGRGCLTAIGGFVVIIVVISVIVAATSHKSGNGTTISLPNSGTSAGATSSAVTNAPEPGPFNGQGTENLGTITVPNNTVLQWSCPSCGPGGATGGANFIVGNSANDSNQIFVNGLNQASGHTVVDGGVYHDVQVNTEGGSWTLTFVHG